MTEEKTINQKEIDRLAFILKQIEEKGLEFYKYNEALVLEYVKKGIAKEIEHYQDLRNKEIDSSLENENKTL